MACEVTLKIFALGFLVFHSVLGTTCNTPDVDDGVVSPNTAIASGATYTVTCNSGHTMFPATSGADVVTCTGTSLSTVPSCPATNNTKCKRPSIPHGTTSPNTSTINVGSNYTVSCDSGYGVSGAEAVVCNNGGVLGTQPTCKEDCTKPVTIVNATINPTWVSVGDGEKYTITCNNSNTHSLTVGNADSTSSRIELECDNGNLGTIPGCYPNCAAPVIAHGTLSPSGSASIVNMATYTLSCGSGYTVSGTATMTCVNGVLDQAPICAKDCEDPSSLIERGTASPSGAISNANSYTIACASGSSLNSTGSAANTMVCTDGVLSTAPTCPRDCTIPTAITNAVTITPQTTIDDSESFTVSCNAGYTLDTVLDDTWDGVSADPTVTQWQNMLAKQGNLLCIDGTLPVNPTCVLGNNCNKPNVPDGTLSPTSAAIQSATSYSLTCDTDFVVTGTSSTTETMLCTNGTLSSYPTCRATTCEPPSIAHGTVSPSVAVKTTESFTLTCGNNYKSSTGSNSIVCDSGTLTTTPECVLSTSCLAPTVTNGVVSPDVTILASGSDYTVKCNPTFTLTGSGTVTCSSGGLSTVPTCVAGRTSCDAPDIGNGTLSPSASIASGEKYTVDCRSSDYTLMGDAVVNCTDGVLTTLPTCDPTAQCLVPDVGNATISPSTPTTTNTNFTVTCNKYFTISGSHVNCTIKDNVAKASTSPTCVPDKCNAATLSVSSGTIKSGQKSEYNFGDKVEWQCNADFELDGNTKVMCIGDTWSSEMPTCKAINKKCTTYDVSNGKLKNAFPYITGDTVQAVCKSTYMVDGTNPITCKATGWSNDPQKCSKNDGTNCKTLVAPKNGNLTCDATTYTAGTKCTVACNTDYVSLSSLTETTCSSVIVWSHETSVNSLAEFAPCIAVIAPKARKLKSEVKMVADYCKTNAEKTKVETALTALLKETLKIPCLVNSKCSVIDYSCDNEQSTKIAIQFTLSQTQDLIDTTLISEAKTMISSSVSGTTFTLSITENRKRATTEMTADNNSFVTSTAVTCESNEVVDSTTGNCVKCPAGYYQSNAACVACPINTYNAAEGAISCQDCADGKLTYGQGSTSSDQCTSLCAVPTISNGKLNYFSGSNVEADTSLTLTCDTGYTTTTATWYCSANAGQTCNALPKNERCGSLSHANSTLSAAHPYFTGQVVNITCAKDYEIKGESSALVICEEFAWNSTRTECKKPGLSEAWKIVIIVVVCVVVLLLILIGAGLLYKNTGKGSVGPHSNHPSKKAHIEDVEYELPDQEQPGTLRNYYNNLVK